MNLTKLFQQKMIEIEESYYNNTKDSHGYPICSVSIHGTVEILIKRSEDSILKRRFANLEDFINWIKE